MEQRPVLSVGSGFLTAEEVAQRLAGQEPSGRRSAPRGPQDDATLRPRGDHDLNPEFYEAISSLTQAAVLIPIVKREPELTVLLTRRTEHLHDHAGQISFPGGRIEPEDADAPAAALRETEEEVGLPSQYVEVVGRLDTYVTRTGFEVAPLVGLVTPPFSLTPDEFEVAEVFEVPLGFLLDPANRRIDSRVYRGKRRHFYAFPYRDYYIWGATAGMLVNLAEILSSDEAAGPSW